MRSGKNKAVIPVIIAVTVLIAATIAVYLVINKPQTDILPSNGKVEDITRPPVVTTIVDNTETTTKVPAETTTIPETTTISEEESYVEQFLAEAETYTTKVEVTTLPPASIKPFFHVVTDGAVSDDNSLTGLTGVSKTIGDVVLAAGFRYDSNQKIFYSESESFQRNLGYTSYYDAGAAFFGMYYDTMRLKFNYNNYDWMIQMWKGRYGITTGAEIGIYYKKEGTDIDFYACADDDNKITMSFALYRGDDLYMTRGPEPHWWLTGFKLLDMVGPHELTMHTTFFMDNIEMADALEDAILDLNFIEGVNYQRLGLTMTIIWN